MEVLLYTCCLIQVGRKEDGSMGPITNVLTFPRLHETDAVGLGFASTGKFVMTCSDKTTLTVWSIRGQEFASVDTYLMSTYCAKVRQSTIRIILMFTRTCN